MPPRNPLAQLVVEGKNDQHVVWALCKVHEIAETFVVEAPSTDRSGVDALLESIPVRLKIPGLATLGIVLDADEDVTARWQSIIQRLHVSGYTMLPAQPESAGTIIYATGKPTVGVWVMPDNQLPGMLENFVTHLIPSNDQLSLHADAVLQTIELEQLNRYALIHRSKAFIHTWLAWQETPGLPMGQAITTRILDHNSPLATIFVEWLRRLFSIESSVTS